MGSQSRSWFGTLNNWTEQEWSRCTETNAPLYSHAVFGKEMGQEETPHLQFNVTMKQKKTLLQMKALFPRAHLEVTRSLTAAERYCKKEENFLVIDNRVRAKQSVETTERLVQYEMDLRAGKTIQEMCDANLVKCAENWKQLEWMASKVRRRRRAKPHVTWCYGKTETGKSQWCDEQAFELEEGFYRHHGKFDWWDGYDGQKVVVLEEFRSSHARLSHLLVFLDRYEVRMGVKGSHTWMIAEHVYINSCFKPDECYASHAEDLAQLKRRIDVLIEFEVVAGVYTQRDRTESEGCGPVHVLPPVDAPWELPPLQELYGSE